MCREPIHKDVELDEAAPANLGVQNQEEPLEWDCKYNHIKSLYIWSKYSKLY